MSTADVRVGDAERDRVTRLLREHCAEGRLDLAELDARLGSALTAETQRDLDVLVADLPSAPRQSVEANARLWWPGVCAFHVERHLQAAIAAVFSDALRVIVPRMAMAGFQLQADLPPRRLAFRSSRGLEVGVLLHPAGDGGTIVAAFGEAPRSVRKAFARMQD